MLKYSRPKLSSLALLAVAVASSSAGAQSLTFVDPGYAGWQMISNVSLPYPGNGAIGLLQTDPTHLDALGFITPGGVYSLPVQSGGALGSPSHLATVGVTYPQYLATYGGGCIYTADSNTWPGDYSNTGIHIIGGINGCTDATVGGPQQAYPAPVYDCFANVATNDLDPGAGLIGHSNVASPTDCPAGTSATGPYRATTDDIRGLTFDAFGNLFFVDNVEATYDNFSFNNGFIGRILGVGATGATPGAQTDRFIDGMRNPLDIVFVPGGDNGTLYFDSQYPPSIGKAVLDASGNLTYLNTDYAEPPNGAGTFGLGADAAGNIWVGTYGGSGSALYKFTDSGDPSTSTWTEIATVAAGVAIRDIVVTSDAIYITNASTVQSYAIPVCNPQTSCNSNQCGSVSDGCGGTLDCGPCDACNPVSYSPAQGNYGMVEFEDLWPLKGDLDFNDESTVYNYAFVYDPYTNRITGMQATFQVTSIGADIHNGLYLQLPISPGKIDSAMLSINGGAPVATAPIYQLPNEVPSGGGGLGHVGVKICRLQNTTFQIAADTRSLYPSGQRFIDTTVDGPILTGNTVTLSVAFTQPFSGLDPGLAPFDIFIARSDDGTHQVHLPDYDGSSTCADQNLFDTGDDGSDTDLSGSAGADNSGRFYVDTNGLPFALNIPQYVDWPIETVAIDQLFPNIDNFAISGGASDSDFYLHSNENTAFSWQENVATGAAQPPAPPLAVGTGLFSNLSVNPCCGDGQVTLSFSEPVAVDGALVGSSYAGAPSYATFSHSVWSNVHLEGPTHGVPWPVTGWLGTGDFAISSDLPIPELKANETEPNVMAIDFSRDISNVSVRGLDLGGAGAEVDLLDGSGNLIDSQQFTSGTGAGNNSFHDFSFPFAAGVRRIEFYQVNNVSGDGDIWQALSYTVSSCP